LKEVKTNRGKITVKPNIVDKAIEFFSPVRAARRFRARAIMSLAGGYIGASKSRRSLKEWTTFHHDADADILPDLPTLRERSRDLIRNNPLATGAIKTKVTNIVGTGLKLQSRVDRAVLNMTDEQADEWEAKTEREWRLFWESKDCDVSRTLNGTGISRLVYRQAKENGDVFIILPRKKLKHFPYDLRLQVIEADRVCNESWAGDTATLAGGVETDKYGAPIKYHIIKSHPGTSKPPIDMTWDKVPAFGTNLGLRNVIHLFAPDRPGQSRGVPDLAPVIEPLKQLGRYTEAELMAAVISSMFTVFIETAASESGWAPDMGDETGAKEADKDYKLASGAIIDLAQGEKVHDSNPGRPNTSFDPFVVSILRQIGVALELPFEILIKHFTASYSASRAAILEAWKYFISERQWLADNFLRVIYEIWMYEAVVFGRIAAPGFLTDPMFRKAYLGSEWVGPAKGQIDELKEIKAAKERVDMGVSTLSEVTSEMTGGDWEKKHPQSCKEFEARKKAGLIQTKSGEGTSNQSIDPENDD
jgi:lambda family phage portal protein